MTVLRELVARLGFQVDGQGFQRADRAVERLRGGMQSLATFATGIGIGAVLKQVVGLASDANETANVLQQVFGDRGAQQVEDWSERMSGSMGRSKFQLREFAGELGAMIDPMVQNTAKAQEMSTTLAALAVDLGSFFNKTDEDALTALRAGLAGEAEPLRRYGVVLLDATLQEYAHTQGIHKKLQAMTVAEKTELRYQFILANTTKAQGDAARTLGGFANMSKALRAVIRDLATEMGVSALPTINKLMGGARDGLMAFRELAKGTQVLQAAMEVLIGTAAILASVMLAPFVAPALEIAAFALLVDELITLFSGGTTVIGSFLDEFGGIGTADELVRNFRTGVDLLTESWKRAREEASGFFAVLPDHKGMAEILTDVGERLGVKFSDLRQDVHDKFWSFVDRGLQSGGQTPFGDLPDAGQPEPTSNDRAAGRGIRARLMTPAERDAARQAERDRVIAAANDRRREERRMRQSQPGFGRASVSIPVPTRSGAPVTNNNLNVTVNASGADHARLGRVVERAARRVLDSTYRNAKAGTTGGTR